MSSFYNSLSSNQSAIQNKAILASQKITRDDAISENKKRAREGIEIPLAMEAIGMGLTPELKKFAKNYGVKALKYLDKLDPDHIKNTVKSFKSGGLQSVLKDSASKFIPQEELEKLVGGRDVLENVKNKIRSLYSSKDEAIAGGHQGIMSALKDKFGRAKGLFSKANGKVANLSVQYKTSAEEHGSSLIDSIKSHSDHPLMKQAGRFDEFIQNGREQVGETFGNEPGRFSILKRARDTVSNTMDNLKSRFSNPLDNSRPELKSLQSGSINRVQDFENPTSFEDSLSSLQSSPAPQLESSIANVLEDVAEEI